MSPPHAFRNGSRAVVGNPFDPDIIVGPLPTEPPPQRLGSRFVLGALVPATAAATRFPNHNEHLHPNAGETP